LTRRDESEDQIRSSDNGQSDLSDQAVTTFREAEVCVKFSSQGLSAGGDARDRHQADGTCETEELAVPVEGHSFLTQNLPESAPSARRDKGFDSGRCVIGKPPGQLSLLPQDKFANPKAKEGIKVLLASSFDAVLVGDGVSILTQGKQAVQDFLR
jgi:hypothetical protein